MKKLLLCLFRAGSAAFFCSLVFAEDPFEEKPALRPPSKEAAAALAEVEKARAKFGQELGKLEEDYFKTLAANIVHADRIELYELAFAKSDPLLDPDGGLGALPESVFFPIRPNHGVRQITKTKKLEGEDKVKVAAMIKDMILKPGAEQALCHYPIHGLRAWIGDQMLFETSICYKCKNFYLGGPFPGWTASWVPLPASAEPLLTKLMPITPEAEADEPAPKTGKEKQKEN